MAQEVTAEGEITLGQLLKIEGTIEPGGRAKWSLQDYDVLLNGERETRREKKLADQDRIDFPDIPGIDSLTIAHQGGQ